mgnify:CR=1 FL=1
MKELITISEESGHAMDEVSNETERTNASAQEIRKVTEIIAGITTFLAMAYILAVNPSYLVELTECQPERYSRQLQFQQV